MFDPQHLDTRHVAEALAIAFAITFTLRAAPFAALGPLRESKLVAAMALWMPAGILFILAASTFRDTVAATPSSLVKAMLSVTVTAGAHLAFGRRTLLSVGLGTLCFTALANFS
ncbi:MAG: branched-chain amino acid transporter permease [Segniliparus sp.]|uniref:branched-chain amino acid transporter permease n=1 Tax=Segniliparus sp. TaxID=2804064 RepID=UPI003F3A8030